MFILDTNVVSELRRADRADAKVKAWASKQSAASFYLSVITILEIEKGILSIERQDQGQGKILRYWLEGQILQHFKGRILVIDETVALRCAKLHVPDPRAERDALIAATALVHGHTIATRNTKDFAPTGVQTMNPWL